MTDQLIIESEAQLEKVVSNVKSLRTILDEEVIVKINLKSIGELRRMLDPMISELDFRAEKILDFMEHTTDPMIAMNNLHSILHSVQKLYEYIDTVKNSPFVAIRRSFYDGKIRRETGNLNQFYVHLLTTLSWDDDGRKNKQAPPTPEPVERDLGPEYHFTEGYKSFYGIGRPKNFSVAFESFEESMRVEENPESMVFLSDFYLLGLNGIGDVFNKFNDVNGTTKLNLSGSWKMTSAVKTKKLDKAANHFTFLNPKLRLQQIRELLERAINLGSLEAKYRMACLILIEEMEPQLIFKACESKFNGSSANIYSHAVLRNILEAIYNNDQDMNDDSEASLHRAADPESIFQDFDVSQSRDGGAGTGSGSEDDTEVRDTRRSNAFGGDKENDGDNADVDADAATAPYKPTKAKAQKTYSSLVRPENSLTDDVDADADADAVGGGISRKEVIDKSVELYLDAGASGHPASQRQFGIICELIGNYTDATEWYSKAAQAGDADAYNCLGLLTHNGRHTKDVSMTEDDFGDGHGHGAAAAAASNPTAHDYEVAYGLFLAAANGGCSCAYNNIGLYHELGLLQGNSPSSSNKDSLTGGIRAALYYYALGAQFGSAMSMYNLGYLLIRQYRRPARGADADFSNTLSVYDRHKGHGDGGVNYAEKLKAISGEESLREGLMWLRKSADFGHLDANFQLGILSETGGGVPKDYNSAFQQYSFICRSHAYHPVAEESGPGTARNVQLVAKASWHAAKLIYYEQILTEKFATMLDYLIFAASNGVVDAILLLGSLYTHGSLGNDFEPDLDKTVIWYHVGATELYSVQCINMLLHLLLQMVADEQSAVKAKRREELPPPPRHGEGDPIPTCLGIVATAKEPSQLSFRALDGSHVITVTDIYNILYDIVTSGKFKKLTVESEYHLIYSQLTQLAKLLL